MRRCLLILTALIVLAVGCSSGTGSTTTGTPAPTAPVQNLTSGQASAAAQTALGPQNGYLADCSQATYNPGQDTWSVQCVIVQSTRSIHLVYDVDDNTKKATLLTQLGTP